jgi:hypothetical protein
MLEFMTWPNVKKFTFITVGNYFKTQKKETMNRADVYRHMQNLQEGERQIFVDKKPDETLVWKYVDKLLEEALAEKKESFTVAEREHYWFKLTEKGRDLHRRVSFALNFGPDDISELVDSLDCKKELADKVNAILDRSYPVPSVEHFRLALDCLKTDFGCEGAIIPDPELLLVSGVYDVNDQNFILGPTYIIPEGIPELSSPGSGAFSITLKDPQRNTLSAVSFDLDNIDFETGEEMDFVPFAFTVALPEDASEFVLAKDGLEIVSQNADAGALKDAIESLPAKAFTKNADEHRNALLNKVSALEKMISSGQTQAAINKLKQDLEPSIEKWVRDYSQDDPLQLSKEQLLELVDVSISRLSSQL